MDSTVCFIDVAIFKEIIDNNRSFAAEFMKDFSRNILSVYNRLVYLTQKQMRGRMADTLIYLFEDIFQSSKFAMHLSRQDIADLSGMSKDSASKVLREFQHEGIINLTEQEMELLDAEKLHKISRIG
jgi:CRP/FNR family transcriptional regulator